MVAELTAKTGWEFPWGEFLDNGSTMDASFSAAGESRASMTIEMEGKDFNEDTPGKILGFASTINPSTDPNRATPTGLYRNLPMRHPLYTWLWATQISSIRGLGYSGGRNGQGDSQYERYLITVAFGSLPFKVYSDDQVGFEWDRFVERHSKPTTQFISSERNDFLISDATATGVAPRMPNGENVKASLGIKYTTWKLQWIWHRVPAPFFQTKYGLATNIAAIVGTLNNAQWPDDDGFRAGTLLCEAPEFTPMEAPVPPGKIWGADLGYRNSPLLYKITVNFSYFDPDTTSTTKGHNLYLGRDGYWYNVVRSVSGSTKQRYEMTNFNNIFFKI